MNSEHGLIMATVSKKRTHRIAGARLKKSSHFAKKVASRAGRFLKKSGHSIKPLGIQLNREESLVVAEALVHPPAPNQVLINAFHAYKQAVAA